MNAIVIIGMLVLFVCAPIGVVFAPKPWHRFTLMVIVGLFFLLAFPAVEYIQRCKVHMAFRSEMVEPTHELWKHIEDQLNGGYIEDARRDVETIRMRWNYPCNPTNTPHEILNSIKTRNPQHQPSASAVGTGR